MLKKIVFILVGIASLLVLISIGVKLFKIGRNEGIIEGEKYYVIRDLLDLAYECFEDNYPRRKSVICNQLKIDSNQEISSSDIIKSINPNKINSSQIETEDLGKTTEIIIRYENQIVYIKKMDHERISS